MSSVNALAMDRIKGHWSPIHIQDFFAQEGDTGKLRNKKRDG
jgi:hypothetical protein